ncbi:hypothetical protein D3C87_145310 [compost metagenome]
MGTKSAKKKAVDAINKKGCLLVFPLNNQKEPESIWSELYPRSKMRWEWDQDGDTRVSDLWILREQLSRSKDVVYAKWYQGRATFFSRDIFVSMLAFLQSESLKVAKLSLSSREALDSLLMDSPQSTKIIKENLSWQGKLMESHYNRAMKPLWNALLIVGFGEVDDSSFPSLNMAATQHIFEDLWLKAQGITPEAAEKHLVKVLGEKSLFLKHARKLAKN